MHGAVYVREGPNICSWTDVLQQEVSDGLLEDTTTYLLRLTGTERMEEIASDIDNSRI
jgi:hypothetical protein